MRSLIKLQSLHITGWLRNKATIVEFFIKPDLNHSEDIKPWEEDRWMFVFKIPFSSDRFTLEVAKRRKRWARYSNEAIRIFNRVGTNEKIKTLLPFRNK